MSINTKICIPCAADNLPDFINQINIAQNHTNHIELRLDALINTSQNINYQDIDIIFKNINKNTKTIVTCRQKQYGGFFKDLLEDNNQKQQEILQYANDIGCDYIDIDYPIYNNIKISNLKSKIIISHHEFETKSPINIDNLNQIKQKMLDTNADILKFAIHCNNDQDAKSLYSLLNINNNTPIILIGMGISGKITRIISPILGSYLTFAMLKEQEKKQKQYTAPGQIEITELKLLYKQINNSIK